MNQNKLIYAEEAYEIQGAIFEVYKIIGSGFLEAVYQECLEKEFTLQNIPFESQTELKIDYKGEILKQTYKPDFICFDNIIVEIKAVKDVCLLIQLSFYAATNRFGFGNSYFFAIP